MQKELPFITNESPFDSNFPQPHDFDRDEAIRKRAEQIEDSGNLMQDPWYWQEFSSGAFAKRKGWPVEECDCGPGEQRDNWLRGWLSEVVDENAA